MLLVHHARLPHNLVYKSNFEKLYNGVHKTDRRFTIPRRNVYLHSQKTPSYIIMLYTKIKKKKKKQATDTNQTFWYVEALCRHHIGRHIPLDQYKLEAAISLAQVRLAKHDIIVICIILVASVRRIQSNFIQI
jgi:hypothetical protein